jgi:transposase
MRRIALAHLKDGKNFTEVADALRVTRHSVMRWLKWFTCGGVGRMAGTPHYWSTQRLPNAQEEAFRQAGMRYWLDQAGWHTTPKLPQFPNVSLLSLPAGHPN